MELEVMRYCVCWQVKVLKRKSMLDELSDDFTRIAMHDLWREFAVVETKAQDLRDQRWVYQVDESRGALGERGLCRESVERMYFQNWGWKGLDGLKLDEFVNVTALKLFVEISMVDEKLDLDLSALKELKVLQVDCPGLAVIFNGLSSLRSLYLLLCCSPGISPCFNEIGCLTNLQYLGLSDVKGVEVLDFTGLGMLREVVLVKLPDLVTVRGFSSRLANLRKLEIVSCMSLEECLGLGEVHSLATIRFIDCGVLTVIPDLGRLSNLRILNIIGCKSLSAVPGFGGLISLKEFNADGCENLVTVPDMGRLTKLSHLNLVRCPMQGLPFLDGLISLIGLCASFGAIAGEKPLFSNLSALKVACIIGWNGCNLWTSIQNLPMLEFLSLEDCRGDDVVPDLQNLERLKHVIIFNCVVRDLSGLSNVTALEVLHVFRCDGLERLPEFERPSKLTELRIDGCKNLGDWPSASNLCSLVSLKVDSVSLTKIMPNLAKLTSLQDLMLSGEGCENVLSLAFLSQLETLEVDGSPRMQSLDLSNYLRLRVLVLLGCSGLERVTCSTPLGALVDVDVRRCEHLVELPDLSMFPELEEVTVRNCSALKELTCSRLLTALEDMTLIGCGSLLGESVDVSKFPKLRRFRRVDSDSSIDPGTLMAGYEEDVRQFRRFPARSVMLQKHGVYGRK